MTTNRCTESSEHYISNNLLPYIRVKPKQQHKSKLSIPMLTHSSFSCSKPNRQSCNHSQTLSCMNLVSHSYWHTILPTNIYQHAIIQILSHAHKNQLIVLSEYIVNTTNTNKCFSHIQGPGPNIMLDPPIWSTILSLS